MSYFCGSINFEVLSYESEKVKKKKKNYVRFLCLFYKQNYRTVFYLICYADIFFFISNIFSLFIFSITRNMWITVITAKNIEKKNQFAKKRMFKWIWMYSLLFTNITIQELTLQTHKTYNEVILQDLIFQHSSTNLIKIKI